MTEGQHFYLKDLLYSLMLESHNDTAVAIAEQIGGSVQRIRGHDEQKSGRAGMYILHISSRRTDWMQRTRTESTTQPPETLPVS